MGLDNLNEIYASGNWYYAQGLGKISGGYASGHTIIIAKDKKEAIEKGQAWIKKEGYRDLHLYRNNYKREARAMLSMGNYIK